MNDSTRVWTCPTVISVSELLDYLLRRPADKRSHLECDACGDIKSHDADKLHKADDAFVENFLLLNLKAQIEAINENTKDLSQD